MRHLWPVLALVACAHAASTPKAGTPALQVEDGVHGVRYSLPQGAGTWQVSREGTARSESGVEAEVSSFPLAKPGDGQQCREHARSRLGGAANAPASAESADSAEKASQTTPNETNAHWRSDRASRSRIGQTIAVTLR